MRESLIPPAALDFSLEIVLPSQETEIAKSFAPLQGLEPAWGREEMKRWHLHTYTGKAGVGWSGAPRKLSLSVIYSFEERQGYCI